MYCADMVAITPIHLQAGQVFQALSDPTRLELIQRLAGGEQCVCDLTDALKTGQSRLSFHLKVLKEAGLIRDRREGRWMYYALNEAAFEETAELIRMLTNGDSVTRIAKRRC
jgi:ArsR family transcriptional regulator